ncbi:arylsulfatase regulator [Citrobacter freundii]|uniref:arylsulfatase regulator n=1 Tax=Citrobacter freundii TaxID=546 RepID=UPI000F6651A8|nr:arylsulfatase regulator [Citrobacter freundii]MBJ8840163.1 arylsulfatase regulator [Citrobacter freundii]MBJ8909816.1 arylsulfatase regulator [Citrobacter freundii]QXR22296.1 arylsulfatase regulator [Citrobacter freundii]
MKVRKKGKYNKLKTLYTKYVFYGAYYCPFLFPKWLVSEVNHRYKDNGNLRGYYNNENPKLVSFLNGEFFWYKTTLSFVIGKNELDKLAKWVVRYSRNSFNSSRYEGVNDVSSIFGSSYYNFGKISVNGYDRFNDSLKPLSSKTKYIDFIMLDLHKYGSDLFILTYEVYMAKDASNAIKNVHVDELVFDAEFDRLNFYSKKNSGFLCLDRSWLASEIICEKFDDVFNDVRIILKELNDIIGISQHEDSVVAVPEICVDEGVDYFSRLNKQEVERAVEIGSYYPSPYLIKDDGGYFLNIYDNTKYSFDALYIYNKINKEGNKGYPEFHPPSNSRSLIRDFSFGILISYEISRLAKQVGDIVTDIHGNVLTKKHNDYFIFYMSSKKIEKWLKAFSRNKNSKVNHLLEYQIEKCNELVNKTEGLYRLSESRIQFDSIKYNKKNSKIIFWFVIIQIILAVLAIDIPKWKIWLNWVRNLF